MLTGIFPGPQSESKKINEMALLICHVDHRAKEVRWKKDGVYIQFDDSDDSRIRVQHFLKLNKKNDDLRKRF